MSATKIERRVDAPTFKLNNSTSIPVQALGLGTRDPPAATAAVIKALEACNSYLSWNSGPCLVTTISLGDGAHLIAGGPGEIGYRHIDTAQLYTTEPAVGDALQKAFANGVVKREDVYVTTKIGPQDLHIDEVVPAIKRSLSKLQLDYVDCYLIHWPLRLKKGTSFLATNHSDRLPLDLKGIWEEMEKLVALGLTKSIGVSNFPVKTLKELLPHAKIVPAVNQIELHPQWQQEKLRTFCQKKGILVSAWSPLGAPGALHGSTTVLNNPILTKIASKHEKSVPQVMLRWEYELGIVSVPKSYNEKRLIENASIWDFTLTDEDHEKIKEIEQICLATAPAFNTVFEGVAWSALDEFHDNEE